MKRIRIGKDISMRWEITTDGVAIPLEGRDLTIEIKSPAGIGNNIPYRVDGNILIMTFYGYEQKRTGEYSITLWENKGKIGQNVVDVVRAFELVRTSQEENDFVGGDLQIESVDLGTENFDILTEGGYRAINIDTLHAEELEDSVNIKGKTYSNDSFTITLPKANLDSAGVMSASDVRTLKEHADSIAQIKTSCEENAADIERVSNVVDIHERRLGSIDAEISSLNTEVSTLQSKVDENTTSISQINNTIADHEGSITQINTKLEEHTESINSKITTDRISDGAVTIGKLEPSIQSLITNISKNASFAGIATPTTNPGTPDGPVFYLAMESGIYPNFGGITISDDEVIILNYTTSWQKLQTGLEKKSKVLEIESYLKPITAVIPITTGNTLLYQLDVSIPKNTDFIVRLDDPNSVISSGNFTIKYSNNNTDSVKTNTDNFFNKDFDITYVRIQRGKSGIINSGNLTLSVDLSQVYNKKEIDGKLDQIQSTIKNIDTVPDAFGSAENLFDNSYFVSNIVQSSSYKGNSYNSGNAYSYENQGIKIPAASYHRFEFYTQTMGIKLGDTINIALHCSKVDDRFVFSGILNNTSFTASKANYNVDGYWYIATVKRTAEGNELRLNFDSRNAVGEVFIDRLFIWKGENIKAYGLNWKTTFQQLEKIKSTKFYAINYAPYYTSFGVVGSVSNERVEKNSLQFTANAGNGYNIVIPILGTIFEDNKSYYISIVNNNIEDNISARNLIVAYINSSNTVISKQTLPLSSLGRLSMLISTPENTVAIRIRVQVSQGTNIDVNVGELFITSFPLTNVEYYDIDRQPLLSVNSDNGLSTIYVDSVSGSDDNDGTSLNYAVKTFTKALSVSKQNCTIILNGDISERLNMAGKQSVRLIGVQGQLNRIMAGTFIRSATSLGGNVYQTTLDTFPTLGVNIIFQHELADESTLIDTEQRHSLQRGKKYRCDSTPIIQAESASEVSSNEFLSYYYDTSSKALTFKIKSGTNLQTNPVVIPSGQANVYGNDGTVHFEMRNIESWYGNLDFRKCNGAIITDCASKYSLAGAGISYDFAVGIILVRCEACRGRDGINAHSLGNRNTLAKCSVLTAIDCWSHDNYDDGYSDHENGEATIIGGLYEHNVKGGITPSYGAQDCYYNVTSQYNVEDGENPYHKGFFLSGAAETSEGGIGSQAILHNCISIGNDVNYECNSSGLADSKEANTMILYNCLSVNAKQYGYSAGSPSKIILYDCRDIGTSTPKNGDGITVKNSTLVDV